MSVWYAFIVDLRVRLDSCTLTHNDTKGIPVNKQTITPVPTKIFVGVSPHTTRMKMVTIAVPEKKRNILIKKASMKQQNYRVTM